MIILLWVVNCGLSRLFASEGLVTDTGIREPEDQFGLMMMAVSALSKQEDDSAVIALFEQHLFWSVSLFKS